MAARRPRGKTAALFQVDPPDAPDAPRWTSTTAIPLLGGPIPAGQVLVETQRNGDRGNFTTLDGRRVCDYPLAGLRRID